MESNAGAESGARMDSATIITESALQLGFDALKDKQMEAVSTFISGSDTFVSLPTGYGKSIIYAILPIVFDKIKGRMAIH